MKREAQLRGDDIEKALQKRLFWNHAMGRHVRNHLQVVKSFGIMFGMSPRALTQCVLSMHYAQRCGMRVVAGGVPH
eukprot:157119-Amphidinium_carterae.1